jgi:hypothetical protein
MIKNLSPNLISAVKDVLKTSSEQIKLQEQKDLDRLNKVKQDTDAIMEKLIGKQHKIDKNKNQKIDAHDFELLRKQKTMKEEEQIDEATKTIDNPKVHDLRHISSHDARSTDERLYAETQTNEKIKDGDVLRTKHGVGIMNQAWPVHHSGKTPFHVLKPGYSMHTIDNGKYKKSVELANKTHIQVTKDRLLNKRKGVTEGVQIDEAKRLVSKHGEGAHTAKVYKDTEWGEYQVHYFKHGKHMGEGPVSHHDDKEDAENTAKHEVKRMDASLKEGRDTPGNSYNHQCAIHVKHEKLGEGKTLFSQHAEPDSEGNIAWYDVMFNEGIKRVNTDELEIIVSEAHKNHKKM